MFRLNIYGLGNKKIISKKDTINYIMYYIEIINKLDFKTFSQRFKSKNITIEDYNNLKFEIFKCL